MPILWVSKVIERASRFEKPHKIAINRLVDPRGGDSADERGGDARRLA